MSRGVAAEFEVFQRVTARFKDAGIHMVAISEPYFGESRAEPDCDKEIDHWNSLIEPYCAANNILLINANTLLKKAAEDSHDYFFQNDGLAWVHPNVRGASEVGVAVARRIESKFTLPAFPVNSSLLDGSPTVLPRFDTAIIGNGSNAWGLTSSNANLTSEFASRSDGQPRNWLQLTIEQCLEGGATSTGNAGFCQLYQTLSGKSLPPSGRYRFVAEIEILNWPETAPPVGESNGRLIQARLSASGGTPPPASTCGLVTSGILYQLHTLGERGSASPVRGAPTNRVAVSTDAVEFSSAAGNTSLSASVTFYGNMTVRISNVGLVRCD